ncbi:MAG: hypothetical protein IPM38_18915 [Ignavibacteria bacterium]|nr:hypothetical protein [Ignavibacteria bacterium]
MKISEKTSGIISDINDISRSFIKNNYEVSALIEISFKSGKQEIFRRLIFTSKYLNGLRNVLTSDKISGKEYIDKTYADFNSNLQKIFDILKLMLTDEDKEVNIFFENKYFTMSHDSISNVIELAKDLSICKEYMNKTPGVFDD